MNQRLWLPGLGWRQANRRLRKRLQRRFSVPMIAIALLIMPVLVIRRQITKLKRRRDEQTSDLCDLE